MSFPRMHHPVVDKNFLRTLFAVNSCRRSSAGCSATGFLDTKKKKKIITSIVS